MGHGTTIAKTTIAKSSLLAGLTLVALVAMLGGLARAGDREIVFEGRHGERISLGVEDNIIVIRDGKGDTSEICTIDLDHIGGIVDEVMRETSDALSELDDMQFQFRLGRDNTFSFETEDEFVQVDLGAIMAEVGMALNDAFAEIDEEWDFSRSGDRSDDLDGNAELRRELDRLRDELRGLKADLRRYHGNVRD